MRPGQSSVRSLVLCGAILSSSQTFAGPLEWRGFFTTGASMSDASTPYQGVTRKTQVTEETYLGLNLSKDLSKEWRIAGQILGRAGQADSTAKVDWAFVTYEPSEDGQVVFGKQKIPIWMTSEYIDVGRAYPWVNPPEEVYSLFPLKSFTGVAAEYRLNLGESALTIEPYTGDIVFESAPDAPENNSKLKASNLYGVAIEWTQAAHLVRLAYKQANWDLNLGGDLEYGVRTLSVLSAGIKSEWNGFLFMSEYALVKDHDEDRYLSKAERILSEPASTPEEILSRATRYALLQQKVGGSAYYATLGKELFDDYLLHLTYAAAKRDFRPDMTRDQSSYALGLNYDINTDVVLKFEAKRVMLPSGSQGLFDSDPGRDHAGIYRIGLSMVF